MAGAPAQQPRHCVSSRVNAPSAVVSPMVHAELLSEYLRQVGRSDHPADRGDAEPDDVPAPRLEAEQGIVGCHAAQLGPRQGEAAAELGQLLRGDRVVTGMVLCCVESGEKPIA